MVQATSILPFADVGALEAVAKAAAAKNKMPHPPPLMGFHLTAAYTTRPHDHLTTLARQLALNPPFTDERPGGGVPLPRDEPLLLRMAQAPAVQLTARLLAIIAANARPLAPTGHGLVLHSIAAMVPAGCLPNVACGHNVMGEVTLLVTRPIAAGAELRCDIRDPTMTRAMRERANMAESLPPCRCARCAVDRTSVEGVRGAWLDRCLEGAACPRCHELLITLPRRRGSAEGDEPSKRHMCPRCCVEPDEDLVNAAARLAREVCRSRIRTVLPLASHLLHPARHPLPPPCPSHGACFSAPTLQGPCTVAGAECLYIAWRGTHAGGGRRPHQRGVDRG